MSDSFKSFHIIDAQKGWLAVDKPCGMSVHNDPGNDLISLLGDRIGSDPGLARRLGVLSSPVVYAVHRLDRETSGVILLATDNEMLRCLSALFINGAVQKNYRALVHGVFDSETKGPGYHVWDYPLSKIDGGRDDPAGKGRRVNCVTRYRVVGQSVHYSLLDIELLTGRKHQIRRHAKLAGHPVTGDRRYGSKKSIQFLTKTKGYNRLGLHCSRIAFIPPGRTEPVCLSSVNPLTDMARLLTEDG